MGLWLLMIKRPKILNILHFLMRFELLLLFKGRKNVLRDLVLSIKRLYFSRLIKPVFIFVIIFSNAFLFFLKEFSNWILILRLLYLHRWKVFKWVLILGSWDIEVLVGITNLLFDEQIWLGQMKRVALNLLL